MQKSVKFLGACIFASVSIVLAAYGLISFVFWFCANAVIFFLALDLRIVPPEEDGGHDVQPNENRSSETPFKTRIVKVRPRNGE